MTDSEYWLIVNRASNGIAPHISVNVLTETDAVYIAMARSNMEPEVFVSMDPEGGTRSVFNGVQTYNGKGDINDPTTWVPTNKGKSFKKSHHIDDHTTLTHRSSQASAKYSTKPNSPS